MYKSIFALFLLMVSSLSWAQELQTSGDKYFYGYAYEDAIRDYQKQMSQGKLMTNHQLLNLADSFFKTGNFKNASRYYLDVYKNDSIMSNNRFNNMLQSLAKTSEPERVKAFLKSNSHSLTNELMENTSFNNELLESNVDGDSNILVFNASGNTPQSDISPAFYKDKILFSSGRKRNSKLVYGPSGESYLNLYVAVIGNDGKLMNPNPFDGVPKSQFHKSTPYYSQELNRLFYVLSNAEDGNLLFDDKGKNSIAIGMVYDNGLFRYVLKDPSSSFYYPFFDDKSGKLYFAANFPDGYGGTDIYYVYTNNSQVMSQPINLGPIINTPGNEIAPYLFEGSIYFSSDIFYGYGGMDIYKSNNFADGSFSIPVNLGNGINSESDDFGLIIRRQDGDAFEGYFSSNRKGGLGKDDLYGFTVNGALGLKTLVFRGHVIKSKTDEGIANASVKLIDAKGNVIKQVSSYENGAYLIEVPWREDVFLQVSKPRFSNFNKSFNAKESEELQQTTFDIGLASVDDIIAEKEDKKVLKLERFVFEKGKSDIFQIVSELDKAVEMIQQFPQIKLRIETHTDSRGNNATNKKLSQSRADNILSYLKSKGVTAANVSSAIGYGEEKLLNSCADGVYCLEFLHNQNDRTLFVILNYDELGL